MGADEGQFVEGTQVDASTERRKQIVDILVTWHEATPGTSLEILESLKVHADIIVKGWWVSASIFRIVRSPLALSRGYSK